MFYSISLYCVFVRNLTAMFLYVTTLHCKWPFGPFAFNKQIKYKIKYKLEDCI